MLLVSLVRGLSWLMGLDDEFLVTTNIEVGYEKAMNR